MTGIIRIGRRRLAALAATVGFALAAGLLSADWAVGALAAVAGGTAIAAGFALVELRRLRRRTTAAERRLGEAAARAEDLRRSAGAQVQAAWEYLRSGPADEPDTFVLYRIIGNDLPPRHRSGQALENLRFTLDREPPLPGCQKRWVVNRIVDPVVEKQVTSLLEERGIPYLHLPFDVEEYRRIGWRFTSFPVPGLTYRREFEAYSPIQRQWALDDVYHDKNLYVMNNNGARNAALAEGRALAKWVLPWDGNCFLTRQAWDGIVAAVTARPYLKYFVVPMARVLDNEALLRPDPEVDLSEEPQLLFRRDAGERFNPDARYGRCPKVELFWRLGITGSWQRWCRGPWDPARPPLSPEAGQVGEAGWVARLYSGEKELERDYDSRAVRRSEAVRAHIDRIDERLAAGSFDAAVPVTLRPAVLNRQRAAWRAGEPGPGRVVGSLLDAAGQTDDATVATLAGVLSGQAPLLQRGADLLLTRYGGGRSGQDPRSAHPPALHHLLDTARMLEREQALAPAGVTQLRVWLSGHREWLHSSQPGGSARAALDHQGTWYDVEIAAIDAYLGDLAGLLATIRRAQERLGQQFDMDGQLRAEAGGDPPHNLHGWVTLAELAALAGQDVWSGLRAPLERAVAQPGRTAEDRSRLAVLAHRAAGAVPALVASLPPAERDPYRLPQVFGDRDGIRPFWSLGQSGGDP